ncbi:hypothetical protein H0H93_003124, partial [Arthromyces matolae]
MPLHLSVTQGLTLGADALHLKHRNPPTAPTGYYDWQVSADPSLEVEGHSYLTNTIHRLQTIREKGIFIPKPSDITALLDTVRNPTSIDDRKGAFATALAILGRLDPYSERARTMNNDVIARLYNTVPHPPASYLGPQFMFRQADGGGNNLQNPDIGRAGTPYSRSVQGKAGLPQSSLPDPGLVFDTLLKRKKMQTHAGGMSSIIFAFGSIVTHTLFRTDPRNIHINNASSYLDLSPIYGDNQASQDKVRDKSSGRGLLYPDTFSEDRLLLHPPINNVILVLFSRNHNYIAKRLLQINEHKRWSDPPPSNPEQRSRQDEEIFQTAKLINCGHFISVVLGDYVASFLGAAEGTNWNMNPFDIIDGKDLKVERGLGNHVSVEFNVLYRWHSTLSAKDEQWTEGVFRQFIGDTPFEELTVKDMRKFFSDVPRDPRERTFAGLKRGPDGSFSDDDLAAILYSAAEEPAGAFGARSTPAVFRVVEILGIEQSRAWGVCTMNEFRKFLGLKAYKTFEDWNPDPEIADAARRLYGHIDNLELYTGLQAEETMPLMDGSRFACGYTTRRAILGDAIALVRGDRFFTSDFTPSNLTTWGFYDCQRNMKNGAGGGHLKMKNSLFRRNVANLYSFDHPSTLPLPKVVNTLAGIKAVLGDPFRFKVVYDRQFGLITSHSNVIKEKDRRISILEALLPDKESLIRHTIWLSTSLTAKIKEKSWQYPNTTNSVDIVNDVINAVCAHVAADKLMGITLKTNDNPSGLFTENEFFDMLTTLRAKEVHTILARLTAQSIIDVSPSTASSNLLDTVITRLSTLFWPPETRACYPFLSALTASQRSIEELVSDVLGVAAGASVYCAHSAVNVINFYLDDSRAQERDAIIRLVNRDDLESDSQLRGYVLEAMRLKPPCPGLWREAVENAIVDQGPDLPPLEVKAGDRVWASFKNAHLNPIDFPEPHQVDPKRPLSSYILSGTSFHDCPGATYAQVAVIEIL